MEGAETTGTQVGRALPDAHRGYMGVTVRALSSGSGGSGGRVSSNREEEKYKWIRGKGNRVMGTQEGTKCNGRRERE